MTSVLIKEQKKVYGPKVYKENGETYRIKAVVRYDDQCGNGHNTFSITGSIDRLNGNGRYIEGSGGCIHEDIAKHFPELAPFIKWHLVSSDWPMHYVANTMYHAEQHGADRAWIYYTPTNSDPLGFEKVKERLLTYTDRAEAIKAEGVAGYRVVWDEKTIKTRKLEHARSCAVWPEATDEELTAPDLEARLIARLPKLMEDFKRDVESLGFVY